MLQAFLNWLQDLKPGAASFLGSFTGASIGLIALLLGALFNARLNRRRDDRIRRQEARALAAALKAELTGIRIDLQRDVFDFETELFADIEGGYNVLDVSQSIRIMPEVLQKFGLLDPDTIHFVLRAYARVERYCESVILLGGKLDERMPDDRRVIYVPGPIVPVLAKIHDKINAEIGEALEQLDAFIKTTRTVFGLPVEAPIEGRDYGQRRWPRYKIWESD